MKKLIILGKGCVCGKPMASIKTKEDIPGYDGEDVWTIATHTIEDADGYLALHGERNHLAQEIKLPTYPQAYANLKLLINNSISVMLLRAVMDDEYDHIRIAGCPLSIGSEYSEQRESLFMVMGYLRGIEDAVITWDNDIPDYNNYYSNALGIGYKND